MKKIFSVSLCLNGILGGGIFAEKEKIVYRTGKLTVEPRLRNLEMPVADIVSAESGRLLFLPTVEIKMKNGGKFKFIVYARKAFLNTLAELGAKL
ncbi:MAG: hypothetical protein NC395_07560 [Prevotella sp.]|nr:hypothetical protein [Prevotella sp.]